MTDTMDLHASLECAPIGRPLDGPVRVLHLNAGNLYGGVETLLTTMARLRDLCPNMEPHFGLCYPGRLSGELASAGVPVYFLGRARLSRPWTIWRARHCLREVLQKEQFHLVVCHMDWSLAVFGSVVQQYGARLGLWAHALLTGEGWLQRLAHRTTPDVAIANSHFTGAGLQNIFPETPCHVIYPPVALTAHRDMDLMRSALRKKLGLRDTDVVIIQVSRIEACKGHPTHLEALAKLKYLKTPWICWLVGGAQSPRERNYLAQLQASAYDLGLTDRVRFLGQRSDVVELLAAADIYCQPNQTPDSFGISFVEALWAGKPVVTSAIGGALEIIDDSCGVLIPPGDSAGLAETLRRLIEQPELRLRLGRGGAPRALHICNPINQMKQLYELSQAPEARRSRP